MTHTTHPTDFPTIRRLDAASVTAERDQILANGFQPIEVRQGAKGGGGALPSKWPETRGQIPFNPLRTGTGILTLDKVGCTDVDIGHDDWETARIIREIAFRYLGETPCVQSRSNSARFKLLYQNLPEADGAYPHYARVLLPTPLSEKNRAVEYLTGKKYFLAFGTHQSGVPFEWMIGSPLTVKREHLPGVTAEKLDEFLEEITERFPRRPELAGRQSRPKCGRPGRKQVSPFADMSSSYQPVWPSDVEAFLRDVPNTAVLVPDYDAYYQIPGHAHAVLRAYKETLLTQRIATADVNAIMECTEAQLREAWLHFAGQQPQDDKNSPERKWEDTRSLTETTGSLFIVLAQQAGYWLPSRRPRVTVLETTKNTAKAAMVTTEEAERLYKEAKSIFRACRSKKLGTVRMLAHLVDTGPSMASLIMSRVVYFIVGQLPLSLLPEMLPILCAAVDHVLGPGAGNPLISWAVRKVRAYQEE